MIGSKLLATATLVAAFALSAGSQLGTTPTEAKAIKVAAQNSTAYTLPPGKLEKAVALDRTAMTLTVTRDIWMVVQLLLILSFGMAARIRDVIVRVTKNVWLQGFSFTFLLLLAMFLLDLPLGIYGHKVATHYGLSVQGWGSWAGDKAKLFALEWAVVSLLMVVVRWIMLKSPGRWWFWFWIPAAACGVAIVFVMPYVIEPLFYQFEPLAATNPALVQRLEQVVARSGIAIPPERMFLMRASAKSTTLNAYVTGFGASKRVVVWDTTLAKSTPDEIAFIFAHEMGHYALDHVVIGVFLSSILMLPFFWLGNLGMRLLLRLYGAAWRIPSQHDWAALAVLALVLLVVSELFNPVQNGVLRWMEHNADVYGQEAVHGIVADPQAVGRSLFQVLGEDSLDDPAPHPLFEWWYGTHPTVPFRSAFAEAYDPWAAGEQPKYFVK